MSFTYDWDETKPAGSRARSLGDDDIREFKYAIRERLAIDHQFQSNETGYATIGYHKQCTLLVSGTAPSALADAGVLYSYDVSAKAELFYKDEDGNAIQITTGGKIKKESIHNNAYVPTGMIAIWSGTLANIPTGWVLCNGSNSTPDLRDNFVVGAANGANPGTTGGASTHVHAVGTYALNSGANVASGANYSVNLSGQSASGSSLPPYYAVAFIYKS